MGAYGPNDLNELRRLLASLSPGESLGPNELANLLGGPGTNPMTPPDYGDQPSREMDIQNRALDLLAQQGDQPGRAMQRANRAPDLQTPPPRLQDLPTNELARVYRPQQGGFVRNENSGETLFLNGQPGGISEQPYSGAMQAQAPQQQSQGQRVRLMGIGNDGIRSDLGETVLDKAPVLDYARPALDVPGVGKAYYAKDGSGAAYAKGPDGQLTKVLLGYDRDAAYQTAKRNFDLRKEQADIAHTQEQVRASQVNNPDWMGTQGAVGAQPGSPAADMSGVPDGVRAQAEAVARGDAPLPSTRSGKMSPIAVLAYQINPALKATDYIQKQQTIQDFSSKGKSGQVVQAINQALHHAATVSDAIDALDNSDTLPGLVNPIKNTVGPYLSGTVTAPGDYVTASNALSEELKKIYAGGGGGNVTEFLAWQKSFNPNAGKTQQKAYLADGMKLLQGAIDSRKKAYERGMGGSADFGTLLDAPAQAALDKLSGLGGIPTQPQPATAPANRPLPNAAAVSAAKNNPALARDFIATFGAEQASRYGIR